MARAGIYRSDVEKARKAILARGQHASIDLVRAELGNTGSKSTIHRYLKEIESDEHAVPKNSVSGLSDDLNDLVQRLAQQLRKEADSRIAEQAAIADSRVQDFQTNAELCRNELNGMADRLQRVEAALATEREAHAISAQTLHDAQLEITQLRERVAAQEVRIGEQSAHAHSIEAKHQQARDALEHFRTAAQEQRAREQRQHDQAMQALQVELRRATDQVTSKNAELHELNRDNGRLLEQATQRQHALNNAEAERRRTSAELESLRKLPSELKALERLVQELQADNSRLDGERRNALGQIEDARRALHSLELDNTKIRAKLDGMQTAMALRVQEGANEADPAIGAST